MDSDDAGSAPASGPAPPGEGRYLALFAQGRTLDIVLALRDGEPWTTEALARHVEVSERTAREQIGVLVRMGVVMRVRSRDPSHRVAWRLGELGLALPELYDLIAHCARRVAPARARSPTSLRARSLVVAEVVADAHLRAIMRILAGGALRSAALERQLPWITHGKLGRDLARLRESGLVVLRPGNGSGRYELVRRARGPLSLIALSALAWRLRIAPRHPPSQAGNVAGLMALLGPVARVAPGIHGVCVMEALVDPGAVGRVDWQPAHVSAARGRLSLLAEGPLERPRARIRASDVVWCEALLSGDFERIEIDGDRELALAVLVALAGALKA